MVKITKSGSTLKQLAYARRAWGAKGPYKKQIALDVGYTHNVANSVVSKIESRKGFNNAMAVLAAESGNVALSIMHEFKSRGVKDFSNQELTKAMVAIGKTWEIYNKGLIAATTPPDQSKNRLRTVIMQNIEKQTINTDKNTLLDSPSAQATPVIHEIVPQSQPLTPDLDF